MESKSIYRQFYNKLIITTSLFIITLSFIFYEYARSTVYDDIQDNMLNQAKQIQVNFISPEQFTPVITQFQTIDIVKNDELKILKFYNYQLGGKYYIKLLYPFDLENGVFLQILHFSIINILLNLF